MPNTTVPAAGEAMPAASGGEITIFLAICLLLSAAALRTRLGRLHLALRLLHLSKATGEAASRVIDGVEKEMRP